jgi:hypothetical protein
MHLINRGADDFSRSKSALFVRSRAGVFVRSAPASNAPWFEVELIDIGLSLPPAPDRQQADRFQRFEVPADIAFVQAQVLRQAHLSRKAEVVLPCVAEQHSEGHLVASTEFLRFEQEVRNLGEATSGRGVRALENDILTLFENVADGSALAVFHTRSLYVARNVISPAYPLLV